MKKSKKSIVLASILFLLTVPLGACEKKIIPITNEKDITVNEDIAEKVKDPREKYKNFMPLNLQKEEVRFTFEGKDFNLELPVYIEKNRYFIPLTEVIEKLDGKIDGNNDKINITINDKNIEINIKENTYLEKGSNKALKTPIIVRGEIVYSSFFDAVNILNLRSRWYEKENIISLHWEKDNSKAIDINNKNSKKAFLRLEDVGAGGVFEERGNLEKLRILSDFMYSKGAMYHIAWIPRYREPNRNIDIDLSKNNSFFAAEFLFTLDYCINKNAIIGLHGYTHQSGNEPSGLGWEFTDKINREEKNIRERVEGAIEIAKELNMPYKFFESPHYGSTSFQKGIIEEYFDYIYEPYFGSSQQSISFGSKNKNTIYVPTPLDYVQGKEKIDIMLYKINNLNKNSLASMFYHPGIDFDYIKLTTDENGYPSYEYDKNSPLHRIIEAFEKKGYSLGSIEELRNK